MVIGAGHDLRDHEPAASRDVQAVLGADVMMGHDPTARAGSSASASAPAAGTGERAAWPREGGMRRASRPDSPTGGPRRPAEARVHVRSATPDALIVFTPSGKRGRFACRHAGTAGRARASASTSIPSAAGAACAVAARSIVAEGEFAKHGVILQRGQPHAVQRGRAALCRQARAA